MKSSEEFAIELITCTSKKNADVVITPSVLTKVKKLIEERDKELQKPIRTWAFRRPNYKTEGGFVQASSAQEAQELIEDAFGTASPLYLYCAATGERYKK